AAGGPHLHSGPEVGPQGVRLLLGETHLRSEGDQQGLGAVVVAAVRLGAQILYFFQTGHGKFLLMVYWHQLKISGVSANRVRTRSSTGRFSGWERVGSAISSLRAESWASLSRRMSPARSASFIWGRPCCRLPKKSPGPRSFRSSSEILKPSVVEARVLSRCMASTLRVLVMSTQ